MSIPRTPIMLRSPISYELKGDPKMWTRHSFSTPCGQTPIAKEDLRNTPLKEPGIVDVNFQIVLTTRQPINEYINIKKNIYLPIFLVLLVQNSSSKRVYSRLPWNVRQGLGAMRTMSFLVPIYFQLSKKERNYNNL